MSARSPGMVNTTVGFESLPLQDNNVREDIIADYELPLTSLSIGCVSSMF